LLEGCLARAAPLGWRGPRESPGHFSAREAMGKGGESTKFVRAPWVKQEAPKRSTYQSAYDSSYKGKGKGKDKGKGKRKGPAPFDSEFWEVKKADENRKALAGTFTGTISKYLGRQGWGLILPDDVDSLPGKAKAALEQSNEEARAKAEEKEREFTSENCIYFRKPDCDPGMFPLQDNMVVNFEVYLDNKGLGACNITSAEVDAEA